MVTNAPQTTQERQSYHGAVFGDGAQDFIEVDAFVGGRAPLVTVKVIFVSGEIRLSLFPWQAEELARHLKQAVEATNV